MIVLFIGDIVGKTGREVVERKVPELRERFAADLVIANGENVAGGLGITRETGDALLATGIDGLTLGNHAYRQREGLGWLDDCPLVVRPANYLKSNPGRGRMVLEAGDRRLGVLNLIGSVGLQAARSPFEAAEEELTSLDADGVDAVLVDFHAEVTSEKIAMGWNLDGRVAAVVGTHTHVPTADARVLPKGTAFICDVGMTGARESVIGVRVEDALAQFRTQIHNRYRSAEGDPWINAVVIEIGRDGLASRIEQVLEPLQ